MQATHGVKPIVTYYKSLVVVDNETGEFAQPNQAVPCELRVVRWRDGGLTRKMFPHSA
jgi:hypothetical protein